MNKAAGLPASNRARRLGISVAAVLMLGSTLPLLAASSASAGTGTPNITLTEKAPAAVLYGSPATVSLTVTNDSVSTPGYNVGFRDVLPVGVAYVPGSTLPTNFGEPTVLANEPSTGQTTLLWPNATDLQPAATETLTFSLQAAVEPATDELLPNSTYTDASSVYVNTNPRTIPSFDATGAPVAASYTGSDTASGTTTISPIALAKSQSMPEAELSRGVHDHLDTYTLTVTNSAKDATNSVVVDDYLPAGLEFLGCGGVDNTTNASGTNPGSKLEYPGAPSLAAGPTLSSNCPAPAVVQTVGLTPSGGDGSQPAQPITPGSAVYTHVEWDLSNMAPGQTTTITYLAAVPLKENTLTWSGGTAPPTTGAQASNLDNNNGPQTVNGQSLSNLATVSGGYTGPVAPGTPTTATAAATSTVEAVDLAIQKSIDNPDFSQGTVHTWTLHYETSEYRYSTGTVVTDTVPAGLCPLGTLNYTTDGGADCNPRSGVGPSPAYSSVTENPDNSFTVNWDLATLPPNTDGTITFPTLDRSDYPGPPVVSADSLSNHVTITGTVNGTCELNGTPDPTCANGGTVLPGEGTPGAASNDSEATETTSPPSVLKEVAVPPATPGGAVNCNTATYVAEPTQPVYANGDTICFQLEATAPSGVNTKNPVITDILPPNSTLVAGSVTENAGNTVPVASIDTTTAGQVTWTLGTTVPGGGSNLYVPPGAIFSYDLAVKPTADPAAGNTFDIVDNLMKVTAVNDAGVAISLRSQAGYLLSRPILTLAKSVASVNGAPPTGNPTQVGDSSVVAYNVALSNAGLVPAVNTAITDTLPRQVTSCASISTITNGGTCQSASQPVTITWSGVGVPAATNATPSVPGTTTLGYSVNLSTLANKPASGEPLTNTASVTSYQNQPNNGGTPVTYTPGTGGSPAATGSATVEVPLPTLAKVATVGGGDGGTNPTAQATIGETVNYTATTVIPGDATVYGAAITDPLGTALTYASAVPLVVTLNGSAATAATAGITAGEAANTVTVSFPTGGFSTAPGAPATIAVSFGATVANVAANVAGSNVTNTATLSWKDSTGAAVTPLTAKAMTAVVEPNIGVKKTDGTGGAAVAPGAAVSYTIVVSNPKNGAKTSTAHQVVATDTLPAGLTYVVGSAVPVPTTISGQVLTWVLPNVAPGATQTITLKAVTPNPIIGQETFINAAAVTAASLDATSPGARTSANLPVGTITGYSASSNDTVTAAGAAVTKTASPTSVIVGGDTTYTVTAAVPANTSFPNLVGVDTLPDGMTFDAYGAISCLNADSTLCGSDYVGKALETPTKAANGTTELAWFIGNLAPSTQVRTITITYTAYPAETNHLGNPITPPLNNSVAARWNLVAGPDPTGLPFTLPTLTSKSSTAPVGVLAPNLVVTKSAGTASPTPGKPITYTVTVTNTGTATAYDATLSDPLPAGLAAPSAISGGGTFTAGAGPGPGTINWTLPAIAPGGANALVYTFTTTLVSPSITTGATLSNTATTSTYDALPGGHASDPTRYPLYGPASGSGSVTPIFPALATAKAASNGSATAQVNQPFGWTVTVTDTTAAPANNVSVTDVLPAGWSYDANSATVNGTLLDASQVTVTGQTLTFSGLGSVVLGGSPLVVTYLATPGPTAALGAAANTNTAYSSGADASGATGNASGPYKSTTASASVTLPAADLALQKTLNAPIVPGTPSTWTLKVSNLGPSSATGLTVVDTLPATATAISGTGGSWSCSPGTGPSSNVLTCTSPESLASGLSDSSLQVTATLPTSATASVTNTAVVSSTSGQFDPNTSNNTSSVTSTPTPESNLVITKSHSGDFVAGEEGSYALSVTNRGPSDAAGPLTVTDQLPVGESFVSFASAGGVTPAWNCSATGAAPQLITCALPGPLAANTAAPGLTLTVAVASSVAGTISNTATVSSPTPPPPGDGPNRTSTDVATVNTSADLSIFKVHQGTFVAGQNGSYTITVANSGPSDAAAPVVTDQLPVGETFVSAGVSGNPNPTWNCAVTPVAPTQLVTCTLSGPLAAGITAPVLNLVVAIAQDQTIALLNTAYVSSTTPDPNPTCSLDTPPATQNCSQDNSSAPATFADLVIKKTPIGPFVAGQQATYDLDVTNEGPSLAQSPVTVSDQLPAGETFVSADPAGSPTWSCSASPTQVVTCTLSAPLPAGAGAPTIVLVVALDPSVPAGPITNTATVSSPTPPPAGDAGNRSDTATQAVTTQATLQLTKTPSSPAFIAGDQGNYTVELTNTGPSDAQSPLVSDPLPTGETLVSASAPSGWDCTGTATVQCTTAGSLAANASVTFTIVVKVASGQPDGTIVNTATASSPTAPQVVTAAASVQVAPEATLQLTKTHVGDFVAGTNGVYTLTVTDLGPSDVQAPVTVTDTLPASETFVSATGGTGADTWSCVQAPVQTVTCTLSAPIVADTAAPTITMTVAVAADVLPASVVNTAAVTGTLVGGVVTPVPAVASDPTTITTAADLSLTKHHTGAFTVGSTGSYTLIVGNAGPSDATGPVIVTDPLPNGETFVSGTGGAVPDDWTCTAAGQLVTCSLPGPLRVGTEAPPIELLVGIGAAAYPGVTNTASVTSATADPDPSNNASSDPAIIVLPITGDPETGTGTGTGGSGGGASGTEVSTGTQSTATGGLAFTGFELAGSLGLSMLLLLAGSALVWVSRHRRRRSPDNS